MQYGLKDKTIEAIKKVISRHDEVEQAVLYGSRAKGNYKEASDIDLVLKGKKLDMSILSKIHWQLDDLLLPYFIDLAIYHHIDNPQLIEHINRVGKIIYQKNDSHS